MKLICDDNLGKLAKFLRILGFDTAFDNNYDDQTLLRIASNEGRFILSRDNNLVRKTHPYGFMIIIYDDPADQLRSVIENLNLTISQESLFRRCSLCNTVCEDVDKAVISDEVFPYILKTQDSIKKCPSCKRYYWKGDHYIKILNKLKSAIPENRLPDDWPI